MTEPKFGHDCNACTFHGRMLLPGSGEEVDLYTCPNSHGPLLRFSDRPDGYMTPYVRENLDVSIAYESESGEKCSGLNGQSLLAFGIQEWLRRRGGSSLCGIPELEEQLKPHRLEVLEEAYQLVENALGTESAEVALGQTILDAHKEIDECQKQE